MSLLSGSVLCFLLTVHMQPSSCTPPLVNLPHINTRPLVLIQKLISGHTSSSSPVDRRKAVTIGGGRWLRPLTFQVPDVLSNLLPSSSNIIKVHDDPRNNKTLHASEAKPNSFDQQQQMPMMGYDPLQLITNFDQNGFLKGLPAGSGPVRPNFAFPNTSFAFDESQLPNMQSPMFALPQTPHFPPAQSALQMNAPMQMNEKQFQTMPLFDQEEPTFHSQVEPSRQKNQFFQEFYNQQNYNQNEDELRPQPNQHRFHPQATLSEDQPKQSFSDPMSESYRHKELFQSAPNYQGDYYPREPHRRLPPSGSGNYDYSRDSFQGSEPSRNNFYSNMPENDMQNSDDNYPSSYGKKLSMSIGYGGGPTAEFDSGKDSHQEGSSALRPFFMSQQKGSELTSTERPYYQEFSPMLSNGFGNDSKISSADQLAASEFYSQHLAPGDNEGVPKGEVKSSLFDGAGKLEQSEPSSFSSYFNTGNAFHQAAASMLNPVVVKSESSQSGAEESPTSDKMLPLLASNGVNVFPSANGQRPVASRIKEFFKSMLTQKY